MNFFCFLFLFPAPSMNGSGLIVSTSDSRWCGQGWFPRRGVYEFAFQLFNMWGSRNERFYGKTWGKTTRGRGYVNFPWGPPWMMVLWKPWNEYRRFAFVLNFPKILHAHISGRQNKNKLKEKHADSSEQLVNRVLTMWILRKICQTVAQHSDVQITGQLPLYSFIVYLQRNDILSKE